MNIKSKLRKALLEAKHAVTHKNEFGCIMVYLKVDENEWNSMLNLIDEDDLYQPKDDPTYGKETEPHVTILFGLHTDVPLKDVEEEIGKISQLSIDFKGISSFSNPQFDVLKFDVDSSDLHAFNKKFREFPHTNRYPDYHPHCTIAYLKPNMAEKYIKKLNSSVKMGMVPSHIVYSMADGTKKEYDLV